MLVIVIGNYLLVYLIFVFFFQFEFFIVENRWLIFNVENKIYFYVIGQYLQKGLKFCY